MAPIWDSTALDSPGGVGKCLFWAYSVLQMKPPNQLNHDERDGEGWSVFKYMTLYRALEMGFQKSLDITVSKSSLSS